MATALVDHLTPADHFNDYVFIKETAKVFLENTNQAYYGGNGKHRELPQRLIGNALRERVENIDPETCDAGDEDTFYVADLGEVYRQHLRWKLNLPRVKPFYGKLPISGVVALALDTLLIHCDSCQVQPGPQGPRAPVRPGHRLRLCLQGRDRAGPRHGC
jgi:hypothetical protein